MNIEKSAELCKVLGDATRLKILDALYNGEMNVNDIAKKLNLNQSTISHQLRVLKSQNLVINRRNGKEVYYSISDEHVKNIIQQVFVHISHS